MGKGINSMSPSKSEAFKVPMVNSPPGSISLGEDWLMKRVRAKEKPGKERLYWEGFERRVCQSGLMPEDERVWNPRPIRPETSLLSSSDETVSTTANC